MSSLSTRAAAARKTTTRIDDLCQAYLIGNVSSCSFFFLWAYHYTNINDDDDDNTTANSSRRVSKSPRTASSRHVPPHSVMKASPAFGRVSRSRTGKYTMTVVASACVRACERQRSSVFLVVVSSQLHSHLSFLCCPPLQFAVEKVATQRSDSVRTHPSEMHWVRQVPTRRSI